MLCKTDVGTVKVFSALSEDLRKFHILISPQSFKVLAIEYQRF